MEINKQITYQRCRIDLMTKKSSKSATLEYEKAILESLLKHANEKKLHTGNL